MKKLVSIVVPAYNEEDCIDELFTRLRNLFLIESKKYDFEVIIVENGSSDKNWEKFYNRVHLLERIHGCSYYKTVRGKHVPMYITREDVQRMIGLHTNSSTMTRSEFLKRQTRGLDI